jgi:hypothetical protein
MQYTTDTANLYRIETAKQPVILTMLGGDELRGHIFIHFSARRPFELEDLSELFNSEEPFFPLGLDNDEVVLVSKERVAEVAADRSDETEHAPREAPSATALLQIVLATGEVRLGAIRLEVRPDRARVLDYLNKLNARFLTLYTSNEARLINRSLIDRVRPLD